MSNSAFSKVNIPVPVTVANGGTGNTSATAYAVLCGGTTSTGAFQSIASVGTAGQVLTSNGAGALPTFQTAVGGPVDFIPASSDAGCSIYTDDIIYLPYTATTTLTVYRGAPESEMRIYSGTTSQAIAVTAIQATANALQGIVKVGTYIYIMFVNGTTTRWCYRADITTDISNSGNWSAITLSGASFAAAKSLRFIGYGNGDFWFANITDAAYVPATLSGTTLTEGTSVTVTGSDYGAESIVNTQGILATFSAAPFLRFADFSGSLTANKTVNSTNGVVSYSIEDQFYVRSSTRSTLIRARLP